MSDMKESELKRNIGLRIIVQRQRMEMSQKELGLRIGVSGQQMQKYENGINGMPAYRLALCAQALNKPVGYFYGDGEDDGTQTTSNILRIAAELDQLPPEGVDTIVDMMRNITRMAELYAEVERRKGVAA